MASTLVNETLQGISQGVSQQFTEARRESQVEEMINCIPSISRGVLRRNPSEFIIDANSSNPFSTTTPYVYSYDRGVGTEQYMIIIGDNGNWKVLNTTTGAILSEGQDLTYLGVNPLNKPARDIYRAITIVDTTFIINTEVEVALKTSTDGTLDSHLGTGVYWVKRTSQVVTHTLVSGDAQGQQLEGYIYELTSGGTTATVQALKNTEPGATDPDRLQGDQIATQIAIDLGGVDYLASGPIVYNKNLVIDPQDVWEWSDSFGNEASYGFKGQVRSTDLLPDKMPSALIGTVVRVTGVTEDTIDDYWMEYTGTTWTETREPGLKNQIDESTMPHVFRRESTGSFTFGFYGEYDLNYTQQIDPATDTDFVQTATEYVKWDIFDSTLQAQFVWDSVEVLRLEAGSVVLKTPYLGNDGWYYEVTEVPPNLGDEVAIRRYQYELIGTPGTSKWDNRLVGDEDSAPAPSFVGKQLTDVFFYKNRLGVLTSEDVLLSELSSYGNFWSTSVRFVPSDDPIDIAIADTSITTLTAAVPTQFSLMLMSDEAQYVLDSNGPLTPSTVVVETATKYNYARQAKAVAIGNEIKFISTSGNYDQLFSYRLSEASDKPTQAEQLTAHIPSYMPVGIHTIIGHSVLGYTFLLADNQLYVHNQLVIDEKVVQSAFHKWEFNKAIYGITIIDNSLILLDSSYNVTKISLEIPGNIKDVTYSDWDGIYASYIHFSKWTIRDANNLGNLRGRLQIRTLQYSIKDDSRYETLITNTTRRANIDYDSTWPVATGIYLTQNQGGETTIWTADDIYLGTTPLVVRQYIDDSKITVAGASDHTEIIFKQNPDAPTEGFELATINYEGLFTQRSRRI